MPICQPLFYPKASPANSRWFLPDFLKSLAVSQAQGNSKVFRKLEISFAVISQNAGKFCRDSAFSLLFRVNSPIQLPLSCPVHILVSSEFRPISHRHWWEKSRRDELKVSSSARMTAMHRTFHLGHRRLRQQ